MTPPPETDPLERMQEVINRARDERITGLLQNMGVNIDSLSDNDGFVEVPRDDEFHPCRAGGAAASAGALVARIVGRGDRPADHLRRLGPGPLGEQIMSWPLVFRWHPSTLLGVVGGVLIALLGIEAVQELQPITIETANAVTVSGVTPDRISIRLEFRGANRACPGMTERYLWRDLAEEDGGAVREFAPLGPALPPFANAITGSRLIVSLARPRGLAPGLWHYQSRTIYRCSWLSYVLGPRVRISPDLTLTF